MFEIKVSQEIKNACPVFAGAAVYAAVKNTAYCDGLWKEINIFTEDLTTLFGLSFRFDPARKGLSEQI